jgi:hypothetical protein
MGRETIFAIKMLGGEVKTNQATSAAQNARVNAGER